MSRQHPALPHQRSAADLPTETSSTSFWHSQPSPLLLAHRSTRNLPQTADVVIIGSGITGASVAHHLLASQNGSSKDEGSRLNVAMLEAREACWGATGRNGGHCQPLLFESPHDPSIGHFELANFHTLQKLIDEENIDCDFVAQPGVRAIYSQHHLDEADMALNTMKTTAPDLHKMMRLITSKDELAQYRIPSAKGALITNVAARMWPYKFVAHILSALLTATDGTFNLQTLTPATSLSFDTASSAWLVHTPRGTIHAQKVVLATNAYTSHLLPAFADLIVPCRGQMSALQPLPSVRGDNRLNTSLGFLGDGLDDYLIQRPNERGGHLMFGGGQQHGPSIGVTDDNVVDSETATYLRTRLITALSLPEKDGTEFKATHEWSGIMGFSRDERPWVGPVPANADADAQSTPGPGLYVSAGYTGHGMPNTWLCGKAVALMVRKTLAFPQDPEWAVEMAAGEVGLPACYRLTGERMARALRAERSVEEKDCAEMERGGAGIVAGGRGGSDRPPSGYA
ncbi:hypothetical protein B0A55_05509 [Friedmanniomyces simplex]|uniref:FAD dependent oxidoreductase domain-containing protein n=1 Tax=Friedmanniomyces simplex TaxID=329884 RepID=A0A4V5NIN6_9PEZI|nr:hypothetical protein B0A55_05509 [Friedmanniomyces simplex]